MKKTICMLLSLLSVLFALIGCASEDAAGKGESTRESATETVAISPQETTKEPQETTSVPQETTSAPQETTVVIETAVTETTVIETTVFETEPIDTGFPNEAESEGTKRY